MSYIPVSRRTLRLHRESERSTRRLVAGLSAAAFVAWLLSVLLSSTVFVDGYVHAIDLVVHDLFLVVAFGAIILVDWHGFLWLIGRRTLGEIIRLDGAATPLIWGGLAGMLATGVFLSPHLDSPMTEVKLAAVLVLSLNGIMLIPLMRRLARLPARTAFGNLSTGQRVHLMSCLVIRSCAGGPQSSLDSSTRSPDKGHLTALPCCRRRTCHAVADARTPLRVACYFSRR